jgi:hypothetical protein
MAAVQRFRQGIRALLAFSRPVEQDLVRSVLTGEQVALFQRLQRSEQQHSIHVLRTLMAADEAVPRDLAAAALLHDVGKPRYPVRVWQKTLNVLIRHFVPRLYRHWSEQGSPNNPFARACVVAKHHPQWGGGLAETVNVSERTLWLIEHHAEDPVKWEDHPNFSLLLRLQQADDAN